MHNGDICSVRRPVCPLHIVQNLARAPPTSGTRASVPAYKKDESRGLLCNASNISPDADTARTSAPFGSTCCDCGLSGASYINPAACLPRPRCKSPSSHPAQTALNAQSLAGRSADGTRQTTLPDLSAAALPLPIQPVAPQLRPSPPPSTRAAPAPTSRARPALQRSPQKFQKSPIRSPT